MHRHREKIDRKDIVERANKIRNEVWREICASIIWLHFKTVLKYLYYNDEKKTYL